jgi:hypothetical protein
MFLGTLGVKGLRLFAYLAVKKPLKGLTAKSAKNAKITQRVELRILPNTKHQLTTCLIISPL